MEYHDEVCIVQLTTLRTMMGQLHRQKAGKMAELQRKQSKQSITECQLVEAAAAVDCVGVNGW